MAMGALATVLLVTGLSIAFPKFGKVMVLLVGLPFLGFVFGGFTWAITSLVFGELASLKAFGMYVVLGTAATFVVFIRMKD